MRKALIETIIISLAIGVYIMYGQIVVDQFVAPLNILPSTYLYAFGAFIVVILSSIAGKMLTRGMN